MTKFALALAAAALLAAPTFSSSAEAGGIRVGFGFPLGSFVARPHQSYGASPSYSAKKHCAKTQRAQYAQAPARKAQKPKVEVAEAPARKIKHTPKVHVAEKAPVKHYKAPVAVKTAKLEDKTVTTDAAPTVYVPETAAVVTPDTTTQTTDTTAETTGVTQTATIETTVAAPATTDVKAQDVKVEEPKVEKVVTIEKETNKVQLSAKAKRVCRRFSAAIAGLVDIPCE